MRQLTRDPFARTTLVRETTASVTACAWCGRVARLFVYGVLPDDRARPVWDGRFFCSKACRCTFYDVEA